MTPRLVAIDQPGGPGFVDRLQEIWADGDAAFPIDQRLSPAAKSDLESRLGVGEPVEPGDALVVATSGTTGTPKGVVLSHDAVAASAEATSSRLQVTHRDHWLACLPLSHVGGLSVVTRALHRDIALTVHPGFDPRAVETAGATMVSLVTAALRRIDPTLFRTIVLGGGRPPAERPRNTVATYGLTETGSGVVYDGVPLDGVDVRIDDGGDTSRAGPILIRGPMLLRAYRDGTDPKDADGWLRTGDVGHWLPDGRLHVDGRADDVIVSGGENVWPDAVERVLADHPGVAEVMVRGVADDVWGEVVEAVVVPAAIEPTLGSLREFVQAEHPAFMAPKRLEIVRELPRTALGKVVRDEMMNHDAEPEP